MPGVGEDLLPCTAFDNSALMHHRNEVSDLPNQAEIVRNQQ